MLEIVTTFVNKHKQNLKIKWKWTNTQWNFSSDSVTTKMSFWEWGRSFSWKWSNFSCIKKNKIKLITSIAELTLHLVLLRKKINRTEISWIQEVGHPYFYLLKFHGVRQGKSPVLRSSAHIIFLLASLFAELPGSIEFMSKANIYWRVF